MIRSPLPGPRLLPLLLAAVPATALAEGPGDAPIAVDGVPAYAVAPPPYTLAPPSYAAPGVAPLAVAGDDGAGPAAGTPIGIARRVLEDPVAERSYLAPTALVAPAGTTTFTIQAPIAPGASVRLDRSFSDRLSLGVGVIGILDTEDLYGVGNLHAKYQLARGERAALAVTASLYNFPAELDLEADNTTLFMPGASASLCTGDDCNTLLTVDVEALAGASDKTLPIVGGVSLASGVGRQLIAELHTTTDQDDRLWFGFIGGRFLGRRVAVDAGLGFGAVRSATKVADCIDVCPADTSSDVEAHAWPFVALSSRL